jgi:hypothetical protein
MGTIRLIFTTSRRQRLRQVGRTFGIFRVAIVGTAEPVLDNFVHLPLDCGDDLIDEPPLGLSFIVDFPQII